MAEASVKPIAVPRMDTVLTAKFRNPRGVLDEMEAVERQAESVERVTVESFLVRVTELVAFGIKTQYRDSISIRSEVGNKELMLGSPNLRLRHTTHFRRLIPQFD